MRLHRAAALLLLGAGLLGACRFAPATGATSLPPSAQVTPAIRSSATSGAPAGSTASPSPLSSRSPTPTTQLAPLPMCSGGTDARLEDLTLTFAAEWDGDLELYDIHADGSGLIQLTSNTMSDLDPAWSPDGRQLAYVERNGQEERLIVVDADGQNTRVLAPESLGPIVYPTWSPDGSRIAFRNLEDLYVVDVETGQALNLTQNTRPFPLEISFSPDGSMLAFNAQSDVVADVNNKLFVINVDGSDPRELTIDEVDSVSWPSWHPAENLILFEGSGPIEGFQLYLARLDRTIERLRRPAGLGLVLPAWSPDGAMISYKARSTGALHVLTADESLDVVALDLSDEVRAGSAIWRYFWAPDSRHVAYMLSDGSADTVGVDLHVLDVCDGASVPIAEAVYEYSLVSWRPNP